MAPKIKGIHHIALKARGLEEFQKTLDFYHGILGLPVKMRWGEGEKQGIMLDTGEGMLEIFANAEDCPGQGALRHMAFMVENVDECIEAVRAKGYKITVEPKDHTFACQPAYDVRLAFCIGPVGEEVEFFSER